MPSVPIRTLIVDDEPVARHVLREELRCFPDVEIIGEAENGRDAVSQIGRLRPDLVFLDLKMPVMGGFEVIHQLPEGALPIIVIVTAYDAHAIQAFEAGALDYLLKPVSQDRLERSLDRARNMRGKTAEVAESLVKLDDASGRPAPRSRKVVGRAGEEFHLLNIEDVLAFQAEREIVWIVTGRQRFVATQTLQTIAARLQDCGFQRVHRNALVNVNHVRKMTPLSSQRWLLSLSNNQELIVSKRQARGVRQMLQW